MSFDLRPTPQNGNHMRHCLGDQELETRIEPNTTGLKKGTIKQSHIYI